MCVCGQSHDGGVFDPRINRKVWRAFSDDAFMVLFLAELKSKTEGSTGGYCEVFLVYARRVFRAERSLDHNMRNVNSTVEGEERNSLGIVGSTGSVVSPSMMHGAAPVSEQVAPVCLMLRTQHESWPLPRPEQPEPPHVPHEACCAWQGSRVVFATRVVWNMSREVPAGIREPTQRGE